MARLVAFLVFVVSGISILVLTLSSATMAKDQFEETILKIVKRDKVPGAAYAIIRNGTVSIGTLGVRSLSQGQPVSSETKFPLASVSKTFAGTLAALLASQGRLDLDASVVNDYPGLRFANQQTARKLSIRHLLSHSAGLVPNAYDNLLEAGQDINAIIPQFEKIKPMCAPGQCYGYQNVLFSLAKPGLERAGGAAYADLLQTYLFTPLGMERAGVGFADYKADDNRVAPHIKARKRWYQRRHKPNYYRAEPAAGVNASIQDMTRWVLALMGNRPDVLASETIALATKPRVVSTRERWRRNWRDHVTKTWYGLGWRIYRFKGEDIVLHGGGVSGIRTQISFSSDRQTALILLFNGETRVHDEIADAFWNSVISIQTASAR